MDIISKIIDLVFDNFFLVIILLGILSFVTQKLRGGANPPQGPQRRGPTPSMPPFGGEGPIRGGGGLLGRPGDGRSSETSRRQPAETAPNYPKYPEQKPDYDYDYTALRAASESKPDVAARKEIADASVQANSRAEPLHLHPGNAVQGMIWAEVFGPPRSRRRHQSRRY